MTSPFKLSAEDASIVARLASLARYAKKPEELPRRPPNILEQIAALKSLHQIDWYMLHLETFEKPPAKALERARHAADVRRRHLLGDAPA